MLPATLSAKKLHAIAESQGLDVKEFSKVTGLTLRESERYLTKDVTAAGHIVTRLIDTLRITPAELFENPDVAKCVEIMYAGEARQRRAKRGVVE